MSSHRATLELAHLPLRNPRGRIYEESRTRYERPKGELSGGDSREVLDNRIGQSHRRFFVRWGRMRGGFGCASALGTPRLANLSGGSVSGCPARGARHTSTVISRLETLALLISSFISGREHSRGQKNATPQGA